MMMSTTVSQREGIRNDARIFVVTQFRKGWSIFILDHIQIAPIFISRYRIYVTNFIKRSTEVLLL